MKQRTLKEVLETSRDSDLLEDETGEVAYRRKEALNTDWRKQMWSGKGR